MSEHILVVDDDPGIQRVITLALDAEGYTVSLAANGQEALQRIAEDRPALVLLDLRMPGMTGADVIRQLRARHHDIRIVLMTGGDRGRAEAEQYGADGYLAKPFELIELVELAERLSGRRDGSAYRPAES